MTRTPKNARVTNENSLPRSLPAGFRPLTSAASSRPCGLSPCPAFVGVGERALGERDVLDCIKQRVPRGGVHAEVRHRRQRVDSDVIRLYPRPLGTHRLVLCPTFVVESNRADVCRVFRQLRACSRNAVDDPVRLHLIRRLVPERDGVGLRTGRAGLPFQRRRCAGTVAGELRRQTPIGTDRWTRDGERFYSRRLRR